MGSETKVECVADVRAELGEGPVWAAEQALYWVDINGRRIFRLDAVGKRDEWPTPMRVGSIAPRAGGGFIAGTDQGIALVDLDQDRFEVVASPERHLPHNRFNDGKVDRQGRFWAGTMDDREKGSAGALYRIDPDRACTAIDGGYGITNGPAFSPDGALMYHSDTLRQVTYAFDLDAAGKASNRRIFLQFGPGDGHPDGMTVDAEGCLWIAFWGGWCVRRFAPDGDLLRTVEMPVEQPSSCAFGGPGLDRLYVTSATKGLDPAALAMQPNAGGLFMLVPGVRGIPDLPFAG
ncbi:MAG TPA: SMP-30/gluconolactonase/LRE family protein [Sphingomicrobium sp.]|nr:SMP-30/gluconolactonase/LRE family protein [Sphingomicrobium sp.]